MVNHSGIRKKNRLLTDALREVRRTRNRFFSLFVLSALAVAFLSGLRAAAPDMEYTADRYYDRLNLMDGQALSTLGLTEDDLRAVEGYDGVAQAEGEYSLDMFAGDEIVHVASLPEELNLLSVTEGRLPQEPGECVTEQMLLDQLGLSLGDTVSLRADEDADLVPLRTEFTVVGVADSPLYVGPDRGSSTLGSGSVSAFFYIPKENFDWDTYTALYFTVDGMKDLDCYSDGYEDRMDAYLEEMEPFGDARARQRYDEVIGEAQAELDDAQQEYDDAKAEVEQELADAERELADARAELDDGWTEYRDGQAELEEETAKAERELADAEQELAGAYDELTGGESDYAEGLAEYEDGLAEWQDGKQDYEDGESDYAEGLAEWEDGKRQYDDGLAEYEQGRADLDEAWEAYESGKEAYDDGRAELNAGESELRAGYQKLQETRAQLDAAWSAAGMTASGAQAALDALNGQMEQAQKRLSLAQEELNALGPDNPNYAKVQAAVTAAQSVVNQLRQSISGIQTLMAAERAYQEGVAEYEAGQRKLDRARSQLDSARKELADALAQLEDGEAELAEGKAELDDAKQELDDGWAELEDARAQLDDAKRELDDGWAELEDARAQLEDARAELDDGWAQYNDGQTELADGRRELQEETAKAEQELADAYAELTDGEAEYADGVAEYEDGKREAEEELGDAEVELRDARQEIAEIEECEWYLLGRSANAGLVGYSQDAERVGNLAAVFPVIFFLVAALACLTTMTRMVEEQRTQIGCLKALGFSRRAISVKYLGYAFFASLTGGVVGLAFGSTVIPLVIANAFGIMYRIPGLEFKFQPGLSAVAVGAAVLCTAGASLWACLRTLIDTPANLMRPKAPPAGKRVFLEYIKPLWKRLSFTWKVTMRNLFRYQRRFWMTVVGIGGCTALIVTGFGLHNSIFDILDKQFDEISVYDATAGLNEELTEGERAEIHEALESDPGVEAYLLSHQESVDAAGADRTVSGVTLFAVADGEEFGEFMTLRHLAGGSPVALPEDGVLITQKLSELLGVQAGGEITITRDNREITAPVRDVVENYVYHYIYLTEDTYAQLFGESVTDNAMMIRYADGSAGTPDRVSRTLMALSGVTSYSNIATIRETFTDSMTSIDYAVVIIIVAAAALAFVVLYNLTNINITERMRELATLKVLGFYDRETTAYIYRENIFLTLFGIALGLGMGRFLHSWMVLTVEVDLVMFGRTAPPYAYLLAAALTALFAAVVNVAAHFSLKKIDMVESLKTVE